VFVTAAASLVGAAVSGQSPQNPTPPNTQFRTAVDLVEVDVTVVDKSGRPVTDLSPADFEIRERGDLQKIENIYLVSEDAAAPTPPPGMPAPAPAIPGAHVPVRALPPRVFVFVFDMAHLSAGGFDRCRNAIRDFLADGLRPNDLAGLVVNGNMLGNRIQTDKHELLKLLDSIGQPNLSRYNEMRQWPRILSEEEALLVTTNNERARQQALQRACAERPEDCQKEGGTAVEAEIEAKSRLITSESARDAQTALTVLQTLANGLGKFPGPKHVVLLSEGFYTGEFTERVTQISGLAARNRVRISTLDARGLNTDPRTQDLFGASPMAGTGDFTNFGFDINADVLATLALETGGQRVRNYNNLRPPLDNIARETGTYYVIGYSPLQGFDGSYRRIDVKVLRPGLTVRARRGYLATVPEKKEASAPSTPPLPAVAPPARSPSSNTPPPVAPTAVTNPAEAGATPPAPSPPAGSPTGTPVVRLRPDASPDIAGVANRISDAAPPNATTPRAVALGRAGWDLYAAGKVEEARDKLAEASAAGGGPWVDYALGYAEFALRHFDAAAIAWQRVRTSRPDHRPVYFDLADAYLQLGRSADALAVLRDAARRWPDDSDAHNAVGIVLLRRSDLDGAIDSFLRAVTAAPRDEIGHFNLGFAYHQRYIRRIGSGAASTAVARQSVADRDRQSALDAYRACAALDGQYAQRAREAIAILEWRK
jgi:VWFA-related protein